MTAQTRAALQALATDPPLDHASDGDALVRDIVDSYGKWEQIGSTQTISSPVTPVDFLSIPSHFSKLYLDFTGASHNSGSSQTLRFALSVDNGSNWLADQALSSTTVNLSTSNRGLLFLIRTSEKTVFKSSGATSGVTAGINAISLATSALVLDTAPFNAIRITWSGGDHDAGTYKLFGM